MYTLREWKYFNHPVTNTKNNMIVNANVIVINNMVMKHLRH